jgi:dTDP-4-dehydrorhamnose reductase
MKIAVIGSSGQLGTDVAAAYLSAGEEAAELTHADIDISSLESTRGALSGIQPAVIEPCCYSRDREFL